MSAIMSNMPIIKNYAHSFISKNDDDKKQLCNLSAQIAKIAGCALAAIAYVFSGYIMTPIALGLSCIAFDISRLSINLNNMIEYEKFEGRIEDQDFLDQDIRRLSEGTILGKLALQQLIPTTFPLREATASSP